MIVRMAVLLAILLTAFTGNVHAELRKGETYQTMVNLHPDGSKRLLYSLNYQLQGFMIPVCSEITITGIKTKQITFTWNDITYTLAWDGHTRKAGVSLMRVAETFFGPACPENGGRDFSPNSFSILTAFGPILPAMLITCHQARAKCAPRLWI